MASETWCMKCKNEQQYGKFCTKCGSRLSANDNICECGEELWKYMNHCPECGKAVSKPVEAGVQ